MSQTGFISHTDTKQSIRADKAAVQRDVQVAKEDALLAKTKAQQFDRGVGFNAPDAGFVAGAPAVATGVVPVTVTEPATVTYTKPMLVEQPVQPALAVQPGDAYIDKQSIKEREKLAKESEKERIKAEKESLKLQAQREKELKKAEADAEKERIKADKLADKEAKKRQKEMERAEKARIHEIEAERRELTRGANAPRPVDGPGVAPLVAGYGPPAMLSHTMGAIDARSSGSMLAGGPMLAGAPLMAGAPLAAGAPVFADASAGASTVPKECASNLTSASAAKTVSNTTSNLSYSSAPALATVTAPTLAASKPAFASSAVASDFQAPREQQRMVLGEEQLVLGKKKEEVGAVDVSKRIETKDVQVPVTLKREEVTVERRPIDHTCAGASCSFKDCSRGQSDHSCLGDSCTFATCKIRGLTKDFGKPLSMQTSAIAEQAVATKSIAPKEEVLVRSNKVAEDKIINETLRSERAVVDKDIQNVPHVQALGSGAGVRTAASGPLVGADGRAVARAEQLSVGKQAVTAGTVGVSKQVDNIPVSQPVRLEHDEVAVERRPASLSSEFDSGALTEGSTRIPITQEREVVGKRVVPKEEVIISKTLKEVPAVVQDRLHEERIDVAKAGDIAWRKPGFGAGAGAAGLGAGAIGVTSSSMSSYSSSSSSSLP